MEDMYVTMSFFSLGLLVSQELRVAKANSRGAGSYVMMDDMSGKHQNGPLTLFHSMLENGRKLKP